MNRSVSRQSTLLILPLFVFALAACPGENPNGPGGDGHPPAPYVGSLEDAPECELSADCPSGTYCDLGQCFQQCNTVDPCTGALVCIPRGRCATTTSAPADPEVQTASTTVLESSQPVVHIGPEDQIATFTVSSSRLDAQVRYRIDSDVPWLRVAQTRGTFTGTLVFMMQVDRTRLDPGEYGGSVIVRTTEGDVSIPVQLEQSLTAVYGGGLEYTTPRQLGQSPLRFELRENAGFASIRIDPSNSPLFPKVDLNGDNTPDDVTSAALVDGGVIEGSFTQTFSPLFFGSEAVFDRTIGRELSYSLSVGEGGVLEGTFSERWFGIFPMPVTVGGTIHVARLNGADDVVGTFSPSLPPSLPTNPSANPPSIAANCSSAASTVVAVAGNVCNVTSTGAQLSACGDAIRVRGSAIDQPSVGLVVAPDTMTPTSGYDDFETVCASDWPVASASAPAPSSIATGCVQRGDLLCAYSLLIAASNLGDTGARPALYRTIQNHTSATLFLTNAALVKAYRVPYASSAGADLSQLTIDNLSTASTYARTGLREMFSPYVLEVLRTTPNSTAAGQSYVAVRQLAQLVGRSTEAFDASLTIETRRGPASVDALRDRIARTGLSTLATMITVSTIAAAEGAPELPELSLLEQSVTRTGRVFLETHADAPMLGVPSGFVPFIFDPTRAGATNFEQNLAQANSAIMAAVAAEGTAVMSTRAFDDQVATLTNQITMLNSTHQSRLLALCGSVPGSPGTANVANCGASSGEAAVAASNFASAQQQVEIAAQRIQDLASRVEVQYRRMNTVLGIDANLIRFTSRTGTQINALDYQNSQLNLVKEALQAAANGSLFNPGGFLASAGIAMVGTKQLDIQKRRAQLALAQELQPLMAQMGTEYANGMATIKDMMISSAELNLELALAMTQAQTAAIQMTNIREEVAFVQAEYDMNVARLNDNSRPLANNPAYRVIRERDIVAAAQARDLAILKTYLAALAFQFETNTTLPSIREVLLPSLRASGVQHFATTCLDLQFGTFLQMYGARQSYTEEISLREDILGIRGPVTDPVTGEVVSPSQQFQRLLLAPSNIGNDRVVTLTFATGVGANNGVFSNSVCNDQIRSIQVKLIGDGLGDDQARIHLEQRGSAFQRSCDAFRSGNGDIVTEYGIPSSQQNHAVIQAGVNAYPMSAADTQLYGRAVGASQWMLSIPPGSSVPGSASGPVEPSNADVDVTHIEDIILRIEHSAISLNASGAVFAAQCQ